MSTPVQGGPGGSLGRAWSRARQTGTTGASTASPLQDKSRPIATSPRDDRDPGASRDALSLRERLASRNALPSRGTPPMRSPLSPREGVSSRDDLDSQDSVLSGDTPPLRSSQSLRDSLVSQGALPSRDALSLRPTPLPEPPLASAKRPISASTAWLRGVILAAGCVLGFLWVTPANQEAALVLQRTPRPAAQSVAAERTPDPSATAEQAAATGAALYQEFLKWLQLRGK